MNASIRQRALRRIISSLLADSFSERDLDEIASSFKDNRDFGFEVGSALMDVTDRLTLQRSRGSISRTDKEDKRVPSTEIQEVEHLIKQQGLNQAQVLDLIRSVDPSASLNLEGKKLATAKFVRRLFEAPSFNREAFIKRLKEKVRKPSDVSDPYLELIDQKQEK